MPPNAPFTVSQDYQIAPLDQEVAFLLPVSDWEYLRDKVTNISSPKILAQTVGSLFLGAALSCTVSSILTYLSGGWSLHRNGVFYIAIIVVCLSIGSCALYIALHQRRAMYISANDVINEMDRLRRKYGGKQRQGDSLAKKLISSIWILTYRPDQSKKISFLMEGEIGLGKNEHENTWDIIENILHIYDENGNLFSKFIYDQLTNTLISANGDETVCKHQQLITP